MKSEGIIIFLMEVKIDTIGFENSLTLLLKLNKHLFYDPAFILIGMCVKEMSANVHTYTHKVKLFS